MFGAKSSPSRFNLHFNVGCALFFITLAAYWPATQYGFVSFDDDRYVTGNAWVAHGFSVASLRWAFTTFDAEFWHPLTWISYLTDHAIYGRFAGGYHLTNILLHAATTLLLFVWLKRVTKALWPSALVAALFAWHPLHVESVAWVAERKDLLSGFFMILTLLVYTRYAERKTASLYLLSLFVFALGLMAKPMLVTLPCLLLLLDYWPLKRVESLEIWKPDWRRLVWEKIPFFVLSFAASVVTIVAQRSGNSLRSVDEVPLSLRLLNALASYGRYLAQTVWPTNLCVQYPLHHELPVVAAACAAAVLAGITWLVFRHRRDCSWGIIGWLWFLGSLVPVIGIVSMGIHAMADRYTYIPSIGLFLAAAWWLQNCCANGRNARWFVVTISALACTACLAVTRQQLSYWRDSISLFEHAIVVAGDSAVSHNNLGSAYSSAGRSDEAVIQFAEAARLNPQYPAAHFNLGIVLAESGKFARAEYHLVEALKLKPDNEILHNNLGVVLAQQGKVDLAMEHFRRAIQIQPDYPKPYVNLAAAFAIRGDFSNAVAEAELARQKAQADNSEELVSQIESNLASYRAGRNPSAPELEKDINGQSRSQLETRH